MSEPLDCRSPDGITVGLIDGLISIARILRTRDLSGEHVREALRDMCEDEDIAYLMGVEGKMRLWEIDIAPEDLRVEMWRTSNQGFVSVASPDAAIRLTHIPTGIQETGYVPETARSQLQVKAILIERIRERLADEYS